ncbi:MULTISPECIES: glycosyltransferase family 2 protein [Arthrobacter]|uniref:glycosyltransferase family 2 protein n=1 Tax=Arthrobacter TaxID=1663 RepID=UPI001D14AA1B|nr:MULTISPECIES: glycosyltransferase family A protein [Arthrobacter]MCC3280964.1 glycosyltransferase family 2 protein [Arthrobacter caoxuetaonis]MCC9192872.1 glycosyltransferase family 2 protein [Arthrobacter sp. zg-Y916]
MSPRISIVIPAYNNAAYLRATLESVFAQTYQDYEVVIADHSSVDKTAEIIDSFAHEPRLRILSPTPHGGGAKANWNRVSQHAEGEWIKLVCGDDLLAPTALEAQVAAADVNPGAVMVASKRDIVDARGKVVIPSRGLADLNGRVPGTDAIRATVRSGTNIFGEPAAVLLKRDVLAEGWWDDSFPYMIDETAYVRVLRSGDLVALPQSLASFRISASQWSVRLAQSQAEQASGLHRAILAEYPEAVSPADVRRGNALALANAYARRLVYLGLRRRMGREHAVESTT